MQVDTALHELGHSIGLYHEQNRRDRDDYIWVRSEYMDPKYRFASVMENEEDITNYGVAYDYGSIMHYGQDVSMSWAKRSCNTEPCIIPAIWRCRKTFGQWQCSFQWKLFCHWQYQVAVVLQGPVLHQNQSWHIIDTWRPHQNGCIINISTKSIPKSPLDNESPLVRITVWHQTVYQPLTELVMTLVGTCMRYQYSIDKLILCNVIFHLILIILHPRFSRFFIDSFVLLYISYHTMIWAPDY